MAGKNTGRIEYSNPDIHTSCDDIVRLALRNQLSVLNVPSDYGGDIFIRIDILLKRANRILNGHSFLLESQLSFHRRST